MKETGIIRRMDDLGRIVIPKEIRRLLNLREGDALELFLHEQGVFYKKYDPAKPVKACLATAARSAILRGSAELLTWRARVCTLTRAALWPR